MMVINIFTYLLIAGILICTNAQWPSHLTCIDNGKSEGIESVRRSQEKLGECMQSVRIEWSRNPTNMTEKEFNALKRSFCENVKALESCLQRFTDSLKSCLGSDYHERLNLQQAAAATFLQSVCDNSELVRKAYAKKCDTECWVIKSQDVKSCFLKSAADFFLGIPSDFIGNFDLVQAAIMIDFSTFNQRQCSAMQNFQECSVNALDDKNDSAYKELLTSIYKDVNNHIPCAKLPKSSASLAGITNVLLTLIPTLAMSL